MFSHVFIATANFEHAFRGAHADSYGAYFRDPDANKLCVVCHEGM
jgi:hypothetical protein